MNVYRISECPLKSILEFALVHFHCRFEVCFVIFVDLWFLHTKIFLLFEFCKVLTRHFKLRIFFQYPESLPISRPGLSIQVPSKLRGTLPLTKTRTELFGDTKFMSSPKMWYVKNLKFILNTTMCFISSFFLIKGT